MNMMRVMIADDEFFAREKLKRLLSGISDVAVVAEAEDGQATLDKVRSHHPDVLFLDVEMPGPSTFDILDQAVNADKTCVIFTTAFDRYAVRAFEAEATDFLLKPYDDHRFLKSLARARRFLEKRKAREEEPVASEMASGEDLAFVDQRDRIVARISGRVIFLKPAEIMWIDAAANYVRLNVRGGQSYLVRQTMNEVQRRLLHNVFVRIHRSFIVNIERVREMRSNGAGDYSVILEGGKQLPLGRTYRAPLQHIMVQRL
jgi:two-component system LytT family response regulator